MFRLVCFWCVIMVAGQSFGQDGVMKKTKVLGGTIIETFVPDPPPQPVPDPAFQTAAPQQITTPQTRHPDGCWCPVCQRRILSQQTRVRSKTIKEYTTVMVVEETHPSQVIKTAPQQPSCSQQRLPSYPWRPFVPPLRQPYGYARHRPVGGFLGINLFGASANVRVGGGYSPPYAQSGYSFGGNHPWYGQ